MASSRTPKVALIHDYLREYGGAERVLEALHEMFPQAPVYVAIYDPKRLGKNAARFKDWDIRQTPLRWFPFAKKLVSPYRIFSAWAFEQLDLSEFDLVISSTNMYMAKAAKTRPDARHVSYIHTPPRSLYGYSTKMHWKQNPWMRVVGEVMNFWMRYVDFRTAQRPNVLLANSQTTQDRIAKFYRRDSTIVPPPVGLVDQHLKVAEKGDRKYALFVGRLGYSKHPELALDVCHTLHIPLKVVGVGEMLPKLKEMAGPEVEFLGAVSDSRLAELYQYAQFVLFPAEDEDFGIVPIEAQSVGTPVIAHFSGEPRSTVQDGVTGIHVQSFKLSDWITAAKEAQAKRWNYPKIQESVQQYSQEEFERAIQVEGSSLRPRRKN